MVTLNPNLFAFDLTRQYLQAGRFNVYQYGTYGTQSPLNPLPSNTSFTLSQLYNGQNEFLPALTVNGSGRTPSQYYSFGGYQNGRIQVATSNTPTSNSPANYYITFDSKGRPQYHSSPTSAPPLSDDLKNTWIYRNNITNQDWEALLSDPDNTEIVLGQLGLIYTTDGAGNITGVRRAITREQITPLPDAVDTANRQQFPLQAILDASRIASATGLPNTPATLSKTPSQNSLNPFNPLNPPAIQSNNGLNALNDKEFGYTPLDAAPEEIQQAALAALRRQQAPGQLQQTATGPNATLSFENAQSVAFQRGQKHLSTVSTTLPQPNTLQELLAAKTYTEATTRLPAERNGIVPLVSPEPPLRTPPQAAYTGGLALHLEIGREGGLGGGTGGSLLGLMLGQSSGGTTTGGENPFQQSPFRQTPPTATEQEQRRRPLSFFA